MFFKEIPQRYYCRSIFFTKIYQNGISFKSNVFKVIFSKWLVEVLLNGRCLSKQCFDSNTQTVLLSKQCFSKKYHNGITIKTNRYYCQKQCFSRKHQHGITFKTNVFQVIFSECFFNLLLNWHCLSKLCF